MKGKEITRRDLLGLRKEPIGQKAQKKREQAQPAQMSEGSPRAPVELPDIKGAEVSRRRFNQGIASTAILNKMPISQSIIDTIASEVGSTVSEATLDVAYKYFGDICHFSSSIMRDEQEITNLSNLLNSTHINKLFEHSRSVRMFFINPDLKTCPEDMPEWFTLNHFLRIERKKIEELREPRHFEDDTRFGNWVADMIEENLEDFMKIHPDTSVGLRSVIESYNKQQADFMSSFSNELCTWIKRVDDENIVPVINTWLGKDAENNMHHYEPSEALDILFKYGTPRGKIIRIFSRSNIDLSRDFGGYQDLLEKIKERRAEIEIEKKNKKAAENRDEYFALEADLKAIHKKMMKMLEKENKTGEPKDEEEWEELSEKAFELDGLLRYQGEEGDVEKKGELRPMGEIAENIKNYRLREAIKEAKNRKN